MKRLAMVLAVAFTMGLATSAVTASTVNDDAKKKEGCKKECSSEKKECSGDKKAEKPAEKK
ncbi:MAG: hypothetical protein Q8P34_17930 [Bacteroidota bacterium]|nr:hypothetical protein [Bacteroidota bacterium]